MREVRNIYVIGMSGVGKSSCTKLLANELNWRRVSTDELIKERTSQSIDELLGSDGGVERFRELETSVLEDLTERRKLVVDSGGGTVISERNRRTMSASGLVVLLKAGAETIIERIRSSNESRPLLRDGARAVNTLLKERQPFYAQNDFEIDTDARSVEEVVDELLVFLKREGEQYGLVI